jgi:hypothetical protein
LVGLDIQVGKNEIEAMQVDEMQSDDEEHMQGEGVQKVLVY